MNNHFCTRCGSPLNEDGSCPNCGTTYTVDGIFDEPQVFGGTYNAEGSGFPQSSEQIDYAEEVPSDEGYAPQSAQDYAYTPQPEADYSYVPQPKTDASYASQPEQRDVGYNNADYAAPPRAEQRQEPSERPKKAGVGEAVKDWLDCAVSFFKEEPFTAVDKVLKGDTHLWAIFAGLNVIFGAFCIAGMFGNGFVWLIDKVFGSYAMLISFYKEYTFGNIFVLFLFSLLTVALLFCAVTGCEYALLSLSQKKPRIEKLVRIVAIAFFPLTIACAAAYIFSFFLMRVAGAIVFAGAIAGFRLLNETVRREEGELPFWNVVLCNTAQAVAAIIIVSISLAVI